MNATPQTERTPLEGLAAEHDVKVISVTRREIEAYIEEGDAFDAADFENALTDAAEAGGPEPRYVVLKVID